MSIALHPIKLKAGWKSISAAGSSLVSLVAYNKGKKAGGGSSITSVDQPKGLSTRMVHRNGVSQTKTMKKKSTKRTVKKKLATVSAVKKMILGNMEVKQLHKTPSFANLVKNTIYTYNLSAQIVQGTADGNRVGDSIFLKRLIGNVRLNTAAPAAYYQFRFLVLMSGEETNPDVNNFSASGLTSTDIFMASSTGFVTAVVNTKACTVLYDTIVDINSQIVGYEDGSIIRLNIKLPKGKFNYQSAGSVFGKTRSLYLVVVGDWVSSNASAPANNGSIGTTFGVLFADN